MNLADHLRRQFAYNAWANRELVSALRTQGSDPRSLALLAHILAAEQLWFERLKQQPQTFPVWPQFDLDQCSARAEQLSSLWTEYLEPITAGDLSLTVSYKNTKGESWTSTIVDILTHVILHSTYHRGQIASHEREIGHSPICSDFIHGIRQGFVK